MFESLERCPGSYCGRMQLVNGNWSECGSCPRGTRVNESYACSLCEEELNTYAWLYLGFMAMLPLMLHCYFIDYDVKDRKFTKKQILLTFCALIETSISAIMAVLLMDPLWEFRLHSCGVKKIADWYTLFYNPIPNYEIRLHCTQEAVYPLQTIVLVFYFFCLVSMFILRPIVNITFKLKAKAPIYSALYFLPLLILLHSLFSGLIYFFFPYLSITISMTTNAIHYSLKLDQSMKALVRSSVKEIKNLITIFSHWLLLAYGIFSLDQHYVLLLLVPFPSLFYIGTVRFTDPQEFFEKEQHRPI